MTEACRPGWPTADAEQLEELLGLAVDLACAAGQLQEQRLWQARQVETKSSASDLVTDVDRVVSG